MLKVMMTAAFNDVSNGRNLTEQGDGDTFLAYTASDMCRAAAIPKMHHGLLLTDVEGVPCAEDFSTDDPTQTPWSSCQDIDSADICWTGSCDLDLIDLRSNTSEEMWDYRSNSDDSALLPNPELPPVANPDALCVALSDALQDTPTNPDTDSIEDKVIVEVARKRSDEKSSSRFMSLLMVPPSKCHVPQISSSTSEVTDVSSSSYCILPQFVPAVTGGNVQETSPAFAPGSWYPITSEQARLSLYSWPICCSNPSPPARALSFGPLSSGCAVSLWWGVLSN
mmetsp:Transcript_153198/g.266501  ORF Transcript_153198/g.266501 Transcript_153198/m.266501 type:complete len:281 (+) Transcript_153198:38-880(+)